MRDFTDEELIEAIKGTGGVITLISKKLGCNWRTAHKNLNRSEEIIATVKDEKETLLDRAEITLIKAINDDDVQTAKWYLQVKGRDRGYTPAMEVNGKIETTLPEGDLLRIAESLKEFFTDDKIEG